MTYSIIPPILVVLSIIGIILFLMKKAPDVALLEEREDMPDRKRMWKGGFMKRQIGVPGQVAEKARPQRSLIFLEKITRRLKVLFLKLENTFTAWNESIRNRRTRKREMPRQMEKPVENYERALDNIRNFDNTRRSMMPEEKPERKEVKEIRIKAEEEERVFRPILSDKVVQPRPRGETKGRLEKILIERIAANPKDVEAYERLGEYYFETNNLIDAKECFKQVIKLDPTNIEVKYKMRKLERLL